MIKSLFCQGFSRKKTELSLLYMRKISQISRKGARKHEKQFLINKGSKL